MSGRRWVHKPSQARIVLRTEGGLDELRDSGSRSRKLRVTGPGWIKKRGLGTS